MATRGRKPGTPKTGGRKKGTPNKVTRDVRLALSESFEKLGGVKWLVWLAHVEPKAYATLLAKLLPSQVTGPDGAPLQAITVNATPAQLRAAVEAALDKV